jgi:endonuclease/exonuclease/phosphatase family metal-dependent hydrolase
MARRAAASHSGDVMRLAHWNIRRAVDPSSNQSSLARVLSCIERLRPTIVTLNEVDTRECPTLLDDMHRLGLTHQAFFGHARDNTYGNALLSTVPLKHVKRTHLDGGTVVRTKAGNTHRIARGLVSASVCVLGVSARVALTHLDHMSAAQRAVQMTHVLSTLDDGSPLEQSLVVGDLNALARADYSRAEWDQHEAVGAANGWGVPHDDAAPESTLSLLGGAGFVDCHAAVAHRPQREWASPPWTAHVHADGPRYRIDYCWLSRPASPVGRRFVPLAAYVEQDCGRASDHQPLVVDLEAIAFDAGE